MSILSRLQSQVTGREIDISPTGRTARIARQGREAIQGSVSNAFRAILPTAEESSSVQAVQTPILTGTDRQRQLESYAQLADDRRRSALETELYQLTQPGRVYNEETTARNRARVQEIENELSTLRPRQSNSRLRSGVQSILSSALGALPAVGETVAQVGRNANAQANDPEYQSLSQRYSQLVGRMEGLERSYRGHEDYLYATEEWNALAREREKVLASLRARGTAFDNPVDVNSEGMRLIRESAQYQQQALEGLEGVPRFLGETALSIGQNAALLPTAAIHPAAPLAAMGTISAANRMYELSERGLSASEALGRGLISGGIEAATEKIPLENLLSVVRTGGTSALRNLLRQAGIEAGEESVSYLANYIADRAAQDPEAEFSLQELARSAAGGALSGGVFGGAAMGINALTRPGTPQVELPSEPGQRVVLPGGEVQSQAASEAAPVLRADQAMLPTEPGQVTVLPSGEISDSQQNGPLNQAQGIQESLASTQTENQAARRHGTQIPVEERTWEDASNRRVNAFQYDHPELRPYYAEAAQALRNELASGTRGERFAIRDQDGYITGYTGTSRSQSSPIEQALDNANLSYADIDRALTAIINDQGQENYAAAKKMELVLDDMLSNGYTGADGHVYGPNDAYLSARESVNRGLPADSTDYHMSEEEWASLLAQDSLDLSSRSGQVYERSGDGASLSDRSPTEDQGVDPQGAEKEGTDMRLWLPRGDQFGEGVDDLPIYKQTSEGNAIKVYRGFNRSKDPLQKNLATTRTIYDVIGKGGSETELIPLEYYTSDYDDALHYASHDIDLLNRLIESKKFDYRGKIIDGEIIRESEGEWAEKEAKKTYEILTGRPAPDVSGDVDEFFIRPNKVLDLSNAGERATIYEIYKVLSEQTGISEYDLDDELTLGDISDSASEGDAIDVFRVLRNSGNSVGSRFYAMMKRLGYDAVKYLESGSEHYAIDRTSEKPGDIQEEQSTLPNTSVGAAPEGFDQWSNFQNQRSQFFPEGANAARPVDVPTTDPQGRPIRKTAATAMGAKAIPDEVVADIQNMVLRGELSYGKVTDRASIERARRTIQDIGYQRALEQFSSQVRRGVVSKDVATLGQQLLVNAANAGDSRATAELLSLYAQLETRAGQAVQAASILRKLSPESQLYAAQRDVSELEKTLKKHYKDIEIAIDPALLEEFAQQTDQAGRDRVLDRIYQNVADQVPSTWRDKWNAWRYLAMLANPRTHVRNVAGNFFFQPLRIVKDRVAAAIEAGVSAAGGGKLQRTKSFLISPELYRAAWSDWFSVRDVLSGNKYDDIRSEINSRRRIFRFAPLEAARTGNSWLLEFEDSIFKRITYADALAGYLQANGVTAEQMRNNTVDAQVMSRARDYAAQEAIRATYQDRNAVSNKVVEVARVLGPAGEAILPFKRTPANILVRGMEYSPAGLAKALTADLVQVRRGNMTGAEAIDHIASGLTGSALFALGAYLFAQGIVTSGGGDDENEDRFNELTGSQNYALNLPDGTNVTLDWLAPEALPFFMGVELMDSMGQSGNTADSIMTALKSISDPMLELSMLQSLNDVIDSVSFSENKLGAMAASSVISYFTQAIPTIGGQIERSAEDVRMSTYTDKNLALPTDIQYAIGRASARIPGVDYQQIPYIDAWGREESSGPTLLRMGNNFLNPAYTSRTEVTPVDEEIRQLYNRTGDGGVVPDRPPRYITVDGERVDLTAAQYTKYATERGQTQFSMLEELFDRPEYNALSSTDRAALVEDVYEYADALAKAEVSSYEPDGWVAKAMESGVNPEDYLIFRAITANITGDKDENGDTISGSKKEKMLAAIDMMDLSVQEKDALYYALGYSESTLRSAPWH